MATIKKSDIYDGNTSKAEHITRIIDALDGTAATEIVATGSFTGSFVGDGSGLTGVGAGFPYTGSAEITGSLNVIGSTTLIQIGSTAVDTINIIPTNLKITGSLLTMNSLESRSTMDLSAMRFGSGFTLSSNQPDEPQQGTMYWDNTGKKLYIHDGSGWYTSSFGAV